MSIEQLSIVSISDALCLRAKKELYPFLTVEYLPTNQPDSDLVVKLWKMLSAL
jgi:hypothetical protein